METEPNEIETLASFLCKRLLGRFVRDPTPFSGPEMNHLDVAVLFVDVSGFSSLADRLAEKGAKGAEELTTILAAFYEPLISLIYEHGGDVIKFSHDGGRFL